MPVSIADKKESAVTKRDEALGKIVCYFDNNHFESELTRRIACKVGATLPDVKLLLPATLKKRLKVLSVL